MHQRSEGVIYYTSILVDSHKLPNWFSAMRQFQYDPSTRASQITSLISFHSSLSSPGQNFWFVRRGGRHLYDWKLRVRCWMLNECYFTSVPSLREPISFICADIDLIESGTFLDHKIQAAISTPDFKPVYWRTWQVLFFIQNKSFWREYLRHCG